MLRGRFIGSAILLAIIAAALVALKIASPVGLSEQPVRSVPGLLSEPAGVPGAGLVLGPDGLGPVTFGQAEPEVMAKLVELIGDPVEDAPQPCPSENHLVRWVRWANLTIALPAGRFSGYISGVYFPPDSPEMTIQTADKVGLRSTIPELAAAYGNRFAWLPGTGTGSGIQTDTFGIDGYDPGSPSATGIGGFIEGGRKAGHVITIIAGQPCGSDGS
ncbi:MAG: hypothetical protein ABI978_00215 [Chloroflexota bacterium]